VKTERSEVEARLKDARPVWVVAPRTVSEPSVAVCAKRLVLDAVVEKSVVVVAFASRVLLLTVSSEPLFPIVVLPFWSMLKTDVVANAAVEDEILKRGVVPPAPPAIESFANGEVVPMPRFTPKFIFSLLAPKVSVRPVPAPSMIEFSWKTRLAPAPTSPMVTSEPLCA